MITRETLYALPSEKLQTELINKTIILTNKQRISEKINIKDQVLTLCYTVHVTFPNMTHSVSQAETARMKPCFLHLIPVFGALFRPSLS